MDGRLYEAAVVFEQVDEERWPEQEENVADLKTKGVKVLKGSI